MNKRRFVKVLIFMIALLDSSAFFQTGFADTVVNVETRIPIQQIVESDKSDVNRSFTYQLQAVDKEAPMPTNDSIYEFTLKDSTTNEIPITFYQPGVYHYQVNQLIPNEKITGYTYDSRQLSIEIYVSYAQNHQLTSIILVKNEKGQKLESLTFKNSFSDQKTIAYPKDKGVLPKTGEEVTFLFSVTGMVCIWLLFLLMMYRRKSDNKSTKEIVTERG